MSAHGQHGPHMNGNGESHSPQSAAGGRGHTVEASQVPCGSTERSRSRSGFHHQPRGREDSGGSQGVSAVPALGNELRGTEARARISGKTTPRRAAAGEEFGVSIWRVGTLGWRTQSCRRSGPNVEAWTVSRMRMAVTRGKSATPATGMTPTLTRRRDSAPVAAAIAEVRAPGRSTVVTRVPPGGERGLVFPRDEAPAPPAAPAARIPNRSAGEGSAPAGAPGAGRNERLKGGGRRAGESAGQLEGAAARMGGSTWQAMTLFRVLQP